MYEAMARRYRPAGFDEVVGQEHVAQTLRNAIASDRVAHAYLFCGPHGCGKTSMARIFARALTCEKGPTPTPCGSCDFCRDIMRGQDVDVQEIDGASNNSVDQVRQLREQAGYIPTRARFKIYIIDEVHMLSTGAFNALLKTLEEPPPHVKFILATTDPHKMPDTVLSRCQRFDFRLVPVPKLAAYFKELAAREQAAIHEDALEAVAAFSGGSVRDGLVLLDQLLSFAQGDVTREDVERVRGVAGAESVSGLVEALCRHDLALSLKIVDDVAQCGINVGDFLDQLISFCRDLMLIVATGSFDGISAYGPSREVLGRLQAAVTLDQVLLLLDVLAQARTRVRSRALTNPLVPLEMAVARLAGVDSLEPVGMMLQKLDALAKGAPLPQTPALPPAVPAGSGAQDIVRPAVSPAATRQINPDTGSETAVASRKHVVHETREASRPDPSPAHESEANAATRGSVSSWAGTPDAAPAAVDVAQVRSAWPRVLEDMQADNSPDVPYLRGGVEVHEVKGSTILLSVPGRFLFDRLEDNRRKERMASYFAKALDADVRIELHLSDQPAEDVADQPRQPRTVPGKTRDDARNDPGVRMVLDAFDGQVTNVEGDE